MRYHEAANFLFNLRRFSMSPGVESVRDLLAELGDPQDGITWVQVAGSNGKGSTARMVESVLREGDQRVGLFTSPHLDDVRERIRVDGRKIPRADVTAFVETVKPMLVDRAADGDPLTFFEVQTALALWHFDRADVDVGVLEVGMGGEFDATSVVDPAASCVTNVTLEHTKVLGDTIEEIATTKAHVAPDENPLVTGATGDALEAVRAQAGEVVTVGGPDADGDADVAVTYGGRVNHTESLVWVESDPLGLAVETRVPLLGSYQASNAGIALSLVRQVAPELSADQLGRGLRKAHWPGRFEVMERDPTVVLDGAHNPGACETVAETLAEFDHEDLHLVFGAMHDKDHHEMVAALPTPESVVTCSPSIGRAEDAEVLGRVFEEAGVDPAAITVGDAVPDALRTARERAATDDLVLVVGSLFCVAESRTTWTREKLPTSVDDETEAERVLRDAEVPEHDVAELAPEGVHRVLKTRLGAQQATIVREHALEAGASCGVSGVESGELLDVVVMGTNAQFRALLDRLPAEGHGLADVADEVRTVLDLDGEPRRIEASASGAESYPWADGTAVMGVLNVTPDSFYDGGEYEAVEDAVARAEAMVEAGADIVDVGGESTRPGAAPVPVAEEIERVVPVIERIADLDVAVSIDTRRAEVGRAALDAGADVLNDVSGLSDPEMRFLAAERDVPIVVMHSLDAPVDPTREVTYDDVVGDVVDELRERILLAEKAGVPREHVVVDPGLGFGKSASENFELLDRLDELRGLGCPVLLGHSRKSMFGALDAPTDDRLASTVAATSLAVERGVDVIRVHDVAENVAAVRVAEAAMDAETVDE